MKQKILYSIALAATMIGVSAPQAPAKPKTLTQRIAALEKTVKQQKKQIRSLSRRTATANTNAVGAFNEVLFLEACLGAVDVNLQSALSDTTLATFTQGTPDGTIPDAFGWFPASIDVIAPGPGAMLVSVDPNCVGTPSPSPAGARALTNRFGFKAKLR